MRHARESRIAAHGDDIVVTVPITLKRRQGRKEITLPGSPKAGTSSRRQVGLALTIAKAHRWRTLLETGRYGTIHELAGVLGIDNSYVARLLRLTLLAPDIIEAILDGSEPDGLSQGRLFRMPPDWEKQRRALGTSPRQ